MCLEHGSGNMEGVSPLWLSRVMEAVDQGVSCCLKIRFRKARA